MLHVRGSIANHRNARGGEGEKYGLKSESRAYHRVGEAGKIAWLARMAVLLCAEKLQNKSRICG